MRGAFVPPSLEEFRLIINSDAVKMQKGGALATTKLFSPPKRSLQGSGIFSSLSGMAKGVAPFIVKNGRMKLRACMEFG